MTKRGGLATGSVAWNVVQFFRANPDEELLTGDICAKWASANASVPQLLEPSVKLGYLAKRVESRTGDSEMRQPGGVRFVYSAGPALRGMNE